MASFPWGRFTLAATALMGIGYGIMKLTVPSEEQMYDKLAPDLKRKVDQARKLRVLRESEMARQVAAQAENQDPDKAKPIWAGPPK